MMMTKLCAPHPQFTQSLCWDKITPECKLYITLISVKKETSLRRGPSQNIRSEERNGVPPWELKTVCVLTVALQPKKIPSAFPSHSILICIKENGPIEFPRRPNAAGCTNEEKSFLTFKKKKKFWPDKKTIMPGGNVVYVPWNNHQDELMHAISKRILSLLWINSILKAHIK